MAAATPNQSSAVKLHPDSLQGSENREDRQSLHNLPGIDASNPPLENTRGGGRVVKFVHRIIF